MGETERRIEYVDPNDQAAAEEFFADMGKVCDMANREKVERDDESHNHEAQTAAERIKLERLGLGGKE